jgi:anti-sigma factor RsiW
VAGDLFADLVELYVLGTLTPEEREVFEAHLAICAQCLGEVREFGPLMALLAAGADAEPSPAVRTALMARIART